MNSDHKARVTRVDDLERQLKSMRGVWGKLSKVVKKLTGTRK